MATLRLHAITAAIDPRSAVTRSLPLATWSLSETRGLTDDNISPLFDTPRYASRFEHAAMSMWEVRDATVMNRSDALAHWQRSHIIVTTSRHC